MAKYGRETNDADIRARQQRDLDKASKMMEEDRNPETRKKYTADQLKDRLSFMTDAMREADRQRKYDAEVADKPKREASNEMRRETRGVQPTPKKDREDMATHNYYKGFDKGLFERGYPMGNKKGGEVKKYAAGGPTRDELKKELREEKPPVPPKQGKDKKEADIFREGMKPPSPNEGPVKKAKGGKVSSASARADGCCQRGKTRGKMV